ncbi:MAG: hypothetical protein ACM3TU_01860 [Bacillota bacterium]
MNSILRAAYLQVCECNTHASIVMDNDTLCNPFFSKTTGLEVAETLEKLGKISTEECKLICDSIRRSALPHCVPATIGVLIAHPTEHTAPVTSNEKTVH